MNKSFSGSGLLGLIIVVIGLLLLVRNIFHIHIPVFTLFASLGLIWMGVMLIRGGKQSPVIDAQAAFGTGTLKYTPGQNSYRVLFNSGVLNLQGITPDTPVHLNLECTFGELKVIVGQDIPLFIEGHAAFGSLSGPDLRSASFGPYTYMSNGYNPSQPGFAIHARVNFGEIRVYCL